MKKILTALVLFGLLAVMAVPTVVSAQVAPVEGCWVTPAMGARIHTFLHHCPWEGGVYNVTTAGAGWAMCCVFNAILTVTDWVFVIIMALVVLLVIWGAFDIVTAAGSTEKVGAGRQKIIYALIGLAVALLARAIPSIVRALLGV